MRADLWETMATVFAAGGGAVLVTLAIGVALVPFFRRIQFVSKESKEGVAQGRRDSVPMGGGFILLLGVTAMVIVFTALEQIRRGYAVCFLIGFWGFGLLGFLDDRSKSLATGYSNKLKVVLQVSVTLAFAVFFNLYYGKFVSYDLEYLSVPFIGLVPFSYAVVPFVMLFLFWVSNAVNITDGFNGLAGGTGAMAALAYAVVTFLIGAAEQNRGTDPYLVYRMYALSRMSAIIGGSLVAYLYFNFRRGSIYFGDTGSMALGAAMAFLAVFSRTEVLFCVIGGVFFIEAASVALQKAAKAVSQRWLDPGALAAHEPFRPFVMAPLHHHFEHLLLRETESANGAASVATADIRRCITLRAWLLSGVFAALGVTAEYGHYLKFQSLYDWSCVAGVTAGVLVLAYGVLTGGLYDCYYIAPNEADDGTLAMYRGIPWRFGARRLHHLYESTDIPLDQLGYLERRTALYHLFNSRPDARVALGLLHYQAAQRGGGEQRRRWLQRALELWDKVPRVQFLQANRRDVLDSMARCFAELDRFADAVEALEGLYSQTDDPAVLDRIELVQRDALQEAEGAYAAWARDHTCQVARAAALAAHEELHRLLALRQERARGVRERVAAAQLEAPDALAERDQQLTALDSQLALLDEALVVAADRCRRLAPDAEAA